MNTRIDVLRYWRATPEQRAEVDHYLEHALGRRAIDVAEVDAATEGTVRITRPLGQQGARYVVSYCAEGRCCSVEPGPCLHREWLHIRETRPAPYPPPWLAWPDPLEEAGHGPR